MTSSYPKAAAQLRVYDTEVALALRIGAAMRGVSASTYAESVLKEALLPENPPEKEEGSKN